jgi:hypothetical protein
MGADTAGTHSSSHMRDIIIQEAASLLAIYAGAASAGVLVRAFAFSSRHARTLIEVQLRDEPLKNNEYASVGAQTWGGACVLAQRIVDYPDQFDLIPHEKNPAGDARPRVRRVLELGAGTGLVSLSLAKLLEADLDWITEKTTIIATDSYPSVLANLQFNIESNFPLQNSTQQVSVSSHYLDWSKLASTEKLSSPFDEPFDLILGADIIYESQHATWIKSCLERLLRKPVVANDNPLVPLFHLVIPLRSTHLDESATVKDVFRSRDDIGDNSMDLCILSQEKIVCDADSDHCRGIDIDDVEYAYYRIGWHETV